MGSIRKHKGSWQGRYRGPDGRVRGKSFKRKADAERWVRVGEASVVTGTWVDPAGGKTTFAAAVERWRPTTAALKPKSIDRHESSLTSHLLPRFGRRPIESIRKSDVRTLVADMAAAGSAPGTIRNTVSTLSVVLEVCVEDNLIASNPTDKVRLPRAARQEMDFLTAVEVEMVARTIRGGYGPWVRFMAYSGLRFGEASALRMRDLDGPGASVMVRESMSEVRGVISFGPTKNYQRRRVTVPRSIIEDLIESVADRMFDSDALVFQAPRGGELRNGNMRARFWYPATDRALGRRPRIHDLRHTAVALAIAQGAHAMAIKERMGHAEVTTTLGRYGHVLPSLEAQIVDGL